MKLDGVFKVILALYAHDDICAGMLFAKRSPCRFSSYYIQMHIQAEKSLNIY